MTAAIPPAFTPGHDEASGQDRIAAREAGAALELLDVLWENARTRDAAPSLPLSQMRLMCIIDGHDGIRMRQAGQLLGAARPSLCRLADRLQALGFIERHPCPGSRKEVILRLAPAGKHHLAQFRDRRTDLLVQAMQSMPAPDRDALARGMAAFRTALATHTASRDLPPPTATNTAIPDRTAASLTA